MDWILADDLGIMERGSYSKCRDKIKDWTKTDEAKNIYSRKELKEIFNHFDCATTKTDFMGFFIFLENELKYCDFENKEN